MYTFTCEHGDETITGPDEALVLEAAKRHVEKKHPKKRQRTPKVDKK